MKKLLVSMMLLYSPVVANATGFAYQPRSADARALDIINVKDYGAKGDAVYIVQKFTMHSGSNILASEAYVFSPSYVGKEIVVPKAGVDGAALVASVVSVQNPHTLTLSVAASTKLEPSNLINVLIGTDDAPAINAAIAAALGRSHQIRSSSRVFYTSDIVFPQGEYLTNEPINLTRIQNPGLRIEGDGAEIHGINVDGVVVDALGSAFFSWSGLNIYGDEYSTPKIGLQIGRSGTTSTISAGNMAYSDFTINGSYTLAALLDENSEVTDFRKINFSNSASNAYAVILDGINHFDAKSNFVTNTQPVDSPNAFTLPTFEGDVFRTTGRAGTSIPLWISGTGQLDIDPSSYVATSGQYGALLYSAPGANNIQMRLNLHFETSSLTDIFLLSGTQPHVVIEGLHYIDNAPFARNSIFKIDPSSSIKSVALLNTNIDIGLFPRGASKVFDNPAMWTVTGWIYLPDISKMNAARFSGVICSLATCLSKFSSLKPRVAVTEQGYTVPPNASLVRFIQTTPVSSTTITLPNRPLDGDSIQFDNYAGVIRSLKFLPHVNGWADGQTFSANFGIRIRWDAIEGAWQREQ